jgi:site-specific recombinase XerD
MDALIDAARHRGRPRDLAIFLLLRFTGMRRGSVAGLRVRHLDDTWGLRDVRQKGGKKQDIPLPAAVVRLLRVYVDRALAPECEALTPDTPLFWSSWGKRTVGRTRAPMTPKNIWRLCKTYGKLIGYPELKPHDLRHGVAVEVLEQRHDLEEVRALLGHARIDTTQIYTKISPAAAQARGGVLRGRGRAAAGRRSGGADTESFEDGRHGFEEHSNVPKTRELKTQ